MEEYNSEIQISSGPVRGVKITSSWSNETIYAFRGIPYASPPTGNLRFKDPVPPQKWTEVKDCTSDQSSCLQNDQGLGNESVVDILKHKGLSEDCLYLNVYSPEPNGGLLPVMVWVHGGAFITGSGNYSDAGPDFLVAEGVVVVTFNYRLGAFGFLTLGTAETPGNSGLKDQRFVLLWVQQEIQKFGGDPSKVTLFGESAGSASVHFHYLSPLSKGLFHRAVGDSGAAIASWAFVEDGTSNGRNLAQILDCNSNSTRQSLQDCLQAADAVEILQAQTKINSLMGGGVSLVFVPTVDKWSAEPFLPEAPLTLVDQRQGSFVPFVMGINRDEGFLLYAEEKKLNDLVKHSIKTLFPVMKENCSGEALKNVERDINRFYFNDTTPSYKNIQGFINFMTDALFAYSTLVSARRFQERSRVYLFHFTFDGDFKDNSYKHRMNMSFVSHAEELNYVFTNKNVNRTAHEDSDEVVTRKRMVRMWTNFIKYGEPANGSDPLLQHVSWLPLTPNSTRHLHIGANLTMVEDDFLPDRMGLWDRISLCSAGPKLRDSAPLYVAASALILGKKNTNF